jgi:hypothetical protein
MTEYFYKLLSIVLLLLLAIVAVGMGYQWRLAAHDREQARSELHDEKGVSEGLRTGIREQNRATEALAKAKALADERGLQAQQLAAASGRRFDQALERERGAKATTCVEAMPVVNRILEAIQ